MRLHPSVMSPRPATSLPVIAEERNSYLEGAHTPPPPLTPAIPPRAWNRPVSKIWELGSSHEPRIERPPPYDQFDAHDVKGPNGEKLTDVRKDRIQNNKHIARRGGWKRLLLIALMTIVIIVGLVVGLVVGLRNCKNKSSSNTNALAGGASGSINNGQDSTTNATFPAGSYTIETVLQSTNTSCESNAAIWTCYPYTTYAVSQTQSQATFNWIITPAGNSNTSYTISSTQNVFSIMFSNASLTLVNPGMDDEYYNFSIPLTKTTKPAPALSSDNSAATCMFTDSMLTGELYTKMPKTLNGTASAEDAMFKAWQYMVNIEQTATATTGSPSCVNAAGTNLGDFTAQGECGCTYVNSGL
ncbi:hypothetical protein BJ878DRAFT_563336 [Calycina marina]|uniref:Tat pathway signal sequence n=1 Tax=Calycina marina TaxID=1763456 RepID=A0A9P8CJS0_9HELO|nr:hypothetical protein BJ878DRAFT_563336 [Calycina marina]